MNYPQLVIPIYSRVKEEDGYTHKTTAKEGEELLDLLIDDGKQVYLVEYTMNQDAITYVAEKANEKGYIPYIGVRTLDSLVNQAFTQSSTKNKVILTHSSISTIVLLRWWKSSYRKDTSQ